MSLRALRRYAVVALAALGGGCIAPVSETQVSNAPAPTRATRPAPVRPAPEPTPVLHEAWFKLGYRLDWRSPAFMSEGGAITRITPAKDMVLVQNEGSTVSLLEPATGNIRWSNELATRLTRFVGLTRDDNDPGRVLVSSDSELFGLAAATGSLMLRERFDRVVNTAPIIDGPTAVYGCSNGEVLAHLIGRQYRAWGFVAHGSFEANPVRVDNTIGLVSQGGDVLFFAGPGSVAGHGRIFAGVATNAVSDGQRLVVASLDQSVWSFYPTGALAWRHRTPHALRVQPAATAEAVYVEIPDAGLTALNTETGAEVWHNKAVHGTVIGTRGGRLVTWDGVQVCILDAARGDILESQPLPGLRFLVTDEFGDGHLYAADEHGLVARFTAR